MSALYFSDLLYLFGYKTTFQAEKELELQLFKLYHNEQDIDDFSEQVSQRNRQLAVEKKKRERVEDEMKEKKKEHGKQGRDLAKIEQKIKEAVSD